MKLIVSELLMSHELECKTESGRLILVDPFSYNALEDGDELTWEEYGKTLVNKMFNMSHFKLVNGTYFCERFEEVE